MSDFSLKPIEEVACIVATTTEFKTNCWYGCEAVGKAKRKWIHTGLKAKRRKAMGLE